MATLFGGSERPSGFDNAATSPISETAAVTRQRQKMLGGSSMSAMLGGSPTVHSHSQGLSHAHHTHHTQQVHHRQLDQHHQYHQQQRRNAGPQADPRKIQWGLGLIRDKCEGRGQSLSNFFVRNTEGDGLLNYSEYQVLLRKLNINVPGDLQMAIFQHLDQDGSGSVSLYEFLDDVQAKQRHSAAPAYAYHNNAYANPASEPATSGSNLTQHDLDWAEKTLIAKLESKRKSLRKTFLAIDNDRNGFVSFKEFESLLRQLNANLVRVALFKLITFTDSPIHTRNVLCV